MRDGISVSDMPFRSRGTVNNEASRSVREYAIPALALSELSVSHIPSKAAATVAHFTGKQQTLWIAGDGSVLYAKETRTLSVAINKLGIPSSQYATFETFLDRELGKVVTWPIPNVSKLVLNRLGAVSRRLVRAAPNRYGVFTAGKKAA